MEQRGKGKARKDVKQQGEQGQKPETQIRHGRDRKQSASPEI